MSEKMNKKIENAKETTSKFKERWKNGNYKKILKRGGIVVIILGQSFFSWDCHHVMY